MIAPIGHAPTANDIAPGEGFAFPMGPRRVVAAKRMVVAGDGALPATVREDVLLLVTEPGTGVSAARSQDRRGRWGLFLWFEIEFEG